MDEHLTLSNSQTSMDGQNAMTRAMVAVEMLSLSNKAFEFKEAPSLTQVISIIYAA